MSEKKIYFASDVHLGAPALNNNRERELLFVSWLDSIKNKADKLFLMGDVFDFWFEYKKAVPRGHTRFLGKLSELSDLGVDIHFFTGNHDFWVFDYLQNECGLTVHYQPEKTELYGKKFFLGHGDGLGNYDKGYKILKKIFTNRFLQWCFHRLHPNFGIWLALKWSKQSRLKDNGTVEAEEFRGEDNEWLVLFSKDVLKAEYFDYFIFGHRHCPADITIGENSRYINLGDWITHFTYAVYDGNAVKLLKYDTKL